MRVLDLQLLPVDTYYQTLLLELPRARKRIVIHAMDIRWGAHLQPFISILAEAAERGVEIRLVGDLYSKHAVTSILGIGTANDLSWGAIGDINDRLRSSGVQVTYIGEVNLNPYKGRTHSKITLIDDFVLSFGGVNFSDVSFTYQDFMLGIHNTALADRLYRLVLDIEKSTGQLMPDLQQPLSQTDTMLFDGGTPGKSMIYETACDLVDRAAKVYYVSQMCPTGRLAKLIKTKAYECHFTQTSKMMGPALVGAFVDKLSSGIVNSYQGQKFIHAKYILTENADGSKHVLTGSHNFSWRGVAYGTREIALHSTNPGLWDACYTFLQYHIRG